MKTLTLMLVTLLALTALVSVDGGEPWAEFPPWIRHETLNAPEAPYRIGSDL